MEALAVAAGVSHNTVRAYERGARVRATTQKRIEEAMRRRAHEGRATLEDVVEAVQALRAELHSAAAEAGDGSSWPRL